MFIYHSQSPFPTVPVDLSQSLSVTDQEEDQTTKDYMVPLVCQPCITPSFVCHADETVENDTFQVSFGT